MLMTEQHDWDTVRIYEILREICIRFRICKGETQFYQTLRHEALGKGDTYICYDNGKEGKPVIHTRSVSRSSAVIIGTPRKMTHAR